MSESTQRQTFGRMGFILAAAGSAIGVGNIWKFPYITYENGGGSFVLIYLIAVLLIGAPIMFAELLIGRQTRLSPVGAFLQLGKNVRGGKAWSVVGWLGLLGGFVIFSYYSVIAGWTVYYFGKCLSWSIGGFTEETAQGLGDSFGAFLANAPLQIGFHALFMIATTSVVYFGIKSGIERVTKTLMPILAALLILLLVNSFFAPGFGEAIAFLFHVGPVSASQVLEAVGHSFFTLSLGMGAMITYGSYVSRKQSIPRAAATVCLFDTLIGMSACVIMFTIIFGVPVAERAGTFSKSATILFTTLPRMFYELPFGAVLAPTFYLLVAFAALTSTISLLEVVVSYFIDVRGWSRSKSTVRLGMVIFLTGVPCALSLGASPFLSNMLVGGFFNTLDYLASNWILPLGGLLIAIFSGWFLDQRIAKAELEEGHGPFPLFKVWRFFIAVAAPIAIIWIVVAVIGGKSFQ
ncbi:MAG: sodium-dependent transporter [Acidobacteriota bacterium]|nr:sodium-dependent transporter [Acidobacteriota bacterium]